MMCLDCRDGNTRACDLGPYPCSEEDSGHPARTAKGRPMTNNKPEATWYPDTPPTPGHQPGSTGATKKKRRWPLIAGLGGALVLGVALGSAGGGETASAPAPTATVTATPEPAPTVTETAEAATEYRTPDACLDYISTSREVIGISAEVVGLQSEALTLAGDAMLDPFGNHDGMVSELEAKTDRLLDLNADLEGLTPGLLAAAEECEAGA